MQDMHSDTGWCGCAELAENLLWRPPASDRLRVKDDVQRLMTEPMDRGSMGMSPALYAWWAGEAGPGLAWTQEEEAARASYSRSAPDLPHQQSVCICLSWGLSG